MSHPTPQHHTTRRVAAVLIGVTAAALVTGCDPATDQPATPETPPAARTGWGPKPVDPTAVFVWGDTTYDGQPVVFSANCDPTGFPYNVDPNTDLARKAARRACTEGDTEAGR